MSAAAWWALGLLLAVAVTWKALIAFRGATIAVPEAAGEPVRLARRGARATRHPAGRRGRLGRRGMSHAPDRATGSEPGYRRQ